MTGKFKTFSSSNFHSVCDHLAQKDKDLADVVKQYGYPPMWTRPNSFETLVHFILEQQVSLASALAALEKLRERIKLITPERLLELNDGELRDCYFSRQKIVYVKSLASAIINNQIDLTEMETLSDERVREKLIALKGIGNWTIDVYLMFVLRHTDIFPVGDLAVRNAVIAVKGIAKNSTKEEILDIAEIWKPYRTVAAMILWHHYLKSRTSKTGKNNISSPV
ncbi:MAG TPA: DNA-3-methyladenine glycosylase [Puia sp.]|nr:DNA-3-methyladenine glycosylase [Puia sp.]